MTDAQFYALSAAVFLAFAALALRDPAPKRPPRRPRWHTKRPS